MKPLNPLRLGMTFAGCFLGAGYVSGQEIWQFFGVFGAAGWLGLMIALAILFGAGCMLLQVAGILGARPVDQLIFGGAAPRLSRCMAMLQMLFLFSVVAVMTAGAGALLKQQLGPEEWIGGLVLTGLIYLGVMKGISGVISLFSVSVPLLAAAALGLSVMAYLYLPEVPADKMRITASPLIGSWLTGGITFASYNLFSSMGVLAVLGGLIQNRAAVYKGVGAGTAVLLLIAGGVLCTVTAHPWLGGEQLPMLALASALHPALGRLYGGLLLTAMFGTALSCMNALTEHLRWYFPKMADRKQRSAGLLLCGTYLSSGAGFSALVGAVYPVFGYCSSIFLVILIIRFVRIRKIRS